ncbi:MAG: zf-HC2 domain-containing protein [Candidatus Acidiferrum sp.]
MSCGRMENRILSYVDGRLKESERLEIAKHIATCAACELRVNEFRAVSSLLDELPQIAPSPAFDVRVRARVAAEPVQQGWWAWFAPSPRVAMAGALLALCVLWVGFRPSAVTPATEAEINQNMPVLENYDVLSNFEPLTDLPAPVADEPQDDANQSNQQM